MLLQMDRVCPYRVTCNLLQNHCKEGHHMYWLQDLVWTVYFEWLLWVQFLFSPASLLDLSWRFASGSFTLRACHVGWSSPVECCREDPISLCPLVVSLAMDTLWIRTCRFCTGYSNFLDPYRFLLYGISPYRSSMVGVSLHHLSLVGLETSVLGDFKKHRSVCFQLQPIRC
jgi:hypothetical protein